jgi:4-hydroxybenzoate polyprenyltransferase
MLTAFSTSLLLSIHLRIEVPLIFFFGTLSLYTFNRYTELKEDEVTYPSRTEFIKEKKKYLLTVTFISYILTILLALNGGLAPLLLILITSIIMILYSVKLSEFRLKEIFIIKNLVVSVVWGIILTFLPILFVERMVTIAYFPVFMALFGLTFINTVIFDVRDMVGDKVHSIMTFPVKYGVDKTRKILFILNTALLFLILISMVLRWLSFFGFIIVATILYLYFVIFMINRANVPLIAAVYGDRSLILYGICGLVMLAV